MEIIKCACCNSEFEYTAEQRANNEQARDLCPNPDCELKTFTPE